MKGRRMVEMDEVRYLVRHHTGDVTLAQLDAVLVRRAQLPNVLGELRNASARS